MPRIMLSIDQIMEREQRDMYFIDFNGKSVGPTPAGTAARKQHFDWFRANNLTWETAAPRGWLEGDPNIFAVFFTGTNDARVSAYAAEFEDAGGTASLNPEAYQMYLIAYQAWLDEGGPARLASDLAEW